MRRGPVLRPRDASETINEVYGRIIRRRNFLGCACLWIETDSSQQIIVSLDLVEPKFSALSPACSAGAVVRAGVVVVDSLEETSAVVKSLVGAPSDNLGDRHTTSPTNFQVLGLGYISEKIE